MSNPKKDKPKFEMGAPVDMAKLVSKRLLTCDTSVYMNPQAPVFFAALEEELVRQGKYIWQSGDTHYELMRIAQDASQIEERRRRADEGLRIFEGMWQRQTLKCFSETPESEVIAENSNARPFLDNVIVSRVRMYGQSIPMGVVTQDGPLAYTLLDKPLFDCAQKDIHPVRVYRLDNEGRLCPLKIDRQSAAKPKPAGRKPLSLLSFRTTLQDALIPVSSSGGPYTGARTGKRYELGELLGSGAEATVYAVEGCDSLCVKLFEQPSIYKVTKVGLLADQPRMQDVALPIEELLGPDGDVAGYAMPKLSGVSLETLCSVRGQERHAPGWTRVEYVQTALSLLNKAEELIAHGILPCDISGKNFIVRREESTGLLDPSRVQVLDVDSMQLGNADLGLIPGDGYGEDYLAPEYQREGLPADGLRSVSSAVYSLTLLAVQLVLGGVHPFRVSSRQEGEELSLCDRIAQEAFPFGAGDLHRQACAASGADLLWSHNTRSFKQFIAGIFRQGGESNPPDARPAIREVRVQVEKLLYWMRNSTDEEDRSLNPSGYRAFVQSCPECGSSFDANKSSADARRLGICDACLNKPCGVCKTCGKPLDMTLREMHRVGLKRPPAQCKACHTASRSAVRTQSVTYTCCPACGTAYRSQLGSCPRCAAKANAPAAAPAAAPRPVVISPVRRVKKSAKPKPSMLDCLRDAINTALQLR